MRKPSQILHNTKKNQKFGSVPSVNEGDLGQLGFDNAALANIIFTIDSGKIIMVNKAALKLLRYSKKLLLTKTRVDIFDITETDFKKALKHRTVSKPAMMLTGLKKGGRRFPC